VLGRGAHGTVYRCRDVGDGALGAVKEMHRLGASAEVEPALALFRREAGLLAALDHPLVPRAALREVDGPFSVDPHTGCACPPDHPGAVNVPRRYYLFMALVPGETLEAKAVQARALGSRLATGDVLGWLEDVGAVLEHLHQQGLIHRDVKPRNIVLADDGPLAGRAVLLDYGLTREVRGAPGYGTVPLGTTGRFGTPGYAPPDPLEQDEPTPASDQYALAMTARRALTGLDPTEPAELALLLKTPLIELRADLEPYQAAALDRAVRPAAGERFPSLAAFFDALRHPPAPLAALPATSWVELHPAALSLGTLHPGEVRDMVLTISDRRPGMRPEGHAVTEDASLRILPPRTRGMQVLLHLVLRVPANAPAGSVETRLTVVANGEEHVVPVRYTVDRTRRQGCLLGLLGAHV
jgi:serine/threonine protein kinase